MIFDKMTAICLGFKSLGFQILKSGPFANQPLIDHSRLVGISDLHGIPGAQIETIWIQNSFENWTFQSLDSEWFGIGIGLQHSNSLS